MVKHAAAGDPLLSAEELVDRGLARMRARVARDGKAFTPQQERWLALIRNHLIENLAIDQEGFDLITFTRIGATWGRVDRDFDGQLETIVAQINEAIAS